MGHKKGGRILSRLDNCGLQRWGSWEEADLFQCAEVHGVEDVFCVVGMLFQRNRLLECVCLQRKRWIHRCKLIPAVEGQALKPTKPFKDGDTFSGNTVLKVFKTNDLEEFQTSSPSNSVYQKSLAPRRGLVSFVSFSRYMQRLGPVLSHRVGQKWVCTCSNEKWHTNKLCASRIHNCRHTLAPPFS